MSRTEILERITGIFRDIFNDAKIAISESSSAKDIDEWDSLNNIQIIIAVEKQFKVRFKASDIRAWKSVGEMCESIEALMAPK